MHSANWKIPFLGRVVLMQGINKKSVSETKSEVW